MTLRHRPSRLPRHRRAGAGGVVFVEVLIAIIPVMVFFFGLLQLAMLYTARLVVTHAATRAARSAVVVLEDNPTRFDCTARGEVTYHDPSGSGASGTETFLQDLADVLEVELPLADVRGMLSSAAGPRLAAIQRAAYMPLATLAPPPETLLASLGLRDNPLGGTGNLTRFLVGLLLYNQAGTMVTLRKSDGAIVNFVAPTDQVIVRVTYLYMCTMPLVSSFMCDSLMELSGLDQLDNDVKAAYDTVKQEGIEGARGAKEQLQADLQKISDKVGSLSRELQYAAAPELLLPFLFSRAHFKLLSAEATMPNQGAAYYSTELPPECGGATEP
jgi:hypothetical protein